MSSTGENSISIALAQVGATLGDLDSNVAAARSALERAERADADLTLFPALALTGAPLEGLKHDRDFIEALRARVERFSSGASGFSSKALIGTLIGDARENLRARPAVAGAIALDGAESREIIPDPRGSISTITVGARAIDLLIIDGARYEERLSQVIAAGAPQSSMIVALTATPYHVGAFARRLKFARALCRARKIPLAWVNLVGAQDGIIFDGDSFALDSNGALLARAAQFREDLLLARFDPARAGRAETISVDEPPAPPDESAEAGEIYEALTLGLKDYARKNRFEECVFGLSGGIDSALVCAIAVDALGAERTNPVIMPSRHSSAASRDDALDLAQALKTNGPIEISIEAPLQSALDELAPHFEKSRSNSTLAQENLQARVRALYLMGLANRFGWLALATGNKSEGALGYATLYGDLAGGFAPLADIFKTRVYQLARWRNERAGCELIPRAILEKAPSAELRPNQKDSDDIPEYETLDPILKAHIEDGMTIDEIVALGYNRRVALEILERIGASEFKRRQAPIGARVTLSAIMGVEWPPSTSAFRRR